MPRMDGTGPDKDGKQTGRSLGKCADNSNDEIISKLGVGMGKRRKTGGGLGLGKRLQSSLKQ